MGRGAFEQWARCGRSPEIMWHELTAWSWKTARSDVCGAMWGDYALWTCKPVYTELPQRKARFLSLSLSLSLCVLAPCSGYAS